MGSAKSRGNTRKIRKRFFGTNVGVAGDLKEVAAGGVGN